MKALSFLLRVRTALVFQFLAIGLLASAGSGARAADTATTPDVVPIPAVSTNAADADKAWKEVYRAVQDPMPPAEWSTNAPTPEELKAFYLPRLLKGADKAQDFYTRFPDHPKAETAHKYEYKLLHMAAQQFGDKTQSDRLAIIIMQRLKDPKLTADERTELVKDPNLPDSERAGLLKDSNLSDDDKFTLRMQAIVPLTAGLPGNLDDYLAKVESLRADYPKQLDVYRLLMTAVKAGAGDKADA